MVGQTSGGKSRGNLSLAKKVNKQGGGLPQPPPGKWEEKKEKNPSTGSGREKNPSTGSGREKKKKEKRNK